MTDAKKPTITMPDLKRDREDESNALYVMRLVQQPVLPQDAYSPNEVPVYSTSARNACTTTQARRDTRSRCANGRTAHEARSSCATSSSNG